MSPVESKKINSAIWVSLISNLFLTVGKLVIGFFSNSQVLIADGIHNAGDVIATITALGSMKVAEKPADFEHPYGHGKSELIGSAFVAILMAMAAIFVAYESFGSLLRPAHVASYPAFFAASVSLLWKVYLYIYCRKIAGKTQSVALMAMAKDHLADVYASGTAIIGIGMGLIGNATDIKMLQYGDAVAGIIVAYFILKLAYEMGKEAIDVLLERTAPVEKLNTYETLILSVPEVKRIDKIRARVFGRYVIIDLRVGILGDKTVQEAHDISRKIKKAIMDNQLDVREVLIHINPWYEERLEK